jgi:methionyl-tRNA formyltransferase
MLRIGWISFHREGFPALKTLLARGVRVEAVITLAPEQLAKRSGAADYGPLTRRFGIPLHQVASINDPEAVKLLTDLALDVAIVLGWSEIIRPPALTSCRLGMIGAHASLLPHNRGSAPVNWALIRGETRGGNTLMWLANGVDTGDIIDQVSFPIDDHDTCATVYDKVAESNREMLLRLLPRLLEGERSGRAQPRGDEALLPRRRPQHGRIDWAQDARAVYNFIRALTRPYPGAFGWLDGRQWLVWQAALFPGEAGAGAAPGEVLGPVVSPTPDACGQAVACGRGVVILLEVEDSDDRVLWGRELSVQLWKGKVWVHDHR